MPEIRSQALNGRTNGIAAAMNHSERHADAAAILDQVMRSRKSVRAFRPDPIPTRLLSEILEAARMSPSNLNSQPWRVYIFCGDAKRALSQAIVQAHIANALPQFSPFPQPTPAECGMRVDEFGRRYYASLGIDRADMAARARQTGRNFTFFDAPVGFIFTIDAALTKHSWLDYGLFLQSLMLAAHVRGLATCPQVSFVRFQSVISEHLGLDANEAVTCGMSCGYADDQAAVNYLDMPREPADGFTRWLGFDDVDASLAGACPARGQFP